MIWIIRMWAWLRSWFGTSQLSSKMSAIKQKVEKLRIDTIQSDRRLQAYQIEASKWQSEIERAMLLNKKMNQALDTALQQIENAEEITIPGLVASHRVLIARWESEVEVHAIRSAGIRNESELSRE